MPSLRLIPLIVAALATAGIAGSALGQTIAADVPLPTGSERVLLSAPAQPRAVLIMLPGGDGIVDIGQTAAAGRLSLNFLVRTLPLWVAQGFAVAILGAPDNRSLLGQRHTPGYAAAIDRAIDFARSPRGGAGLAGRNQPGIDRRRQRRRPARRQDRRRCPDLVGDAAELLGRDRVRRQPGGDLGSGADCR